MGKFIITDETLKRYHSGLSTAEESLAVEAWLEDTEEDISLAHDPLEEDRIETALWNRIWHFTILPEKRTRQFKLWQKRLAVAATLIIALSFLFLMYKNGLNQSAPTFIQINNFAGQSAKVQNINGLILTALPKANINARISHSSGNVSFCDVMLIQNKSVEDMSLDFVTDCSDKNAEPKNFICKRGITYVALRMNRISPEIIVVDQRYMEDLLPLSVAMRINKDLQSI